jgi:hypothetical protein
MKIAAGSIFSDSWDILPAAVANLVSLGVEDFYLIDHLSQENRGDELSALFADKARVRVARKMTAPFLQGRTMSILAEAARRDGFSHFIPFDSDEFLDISESGGTHPPSLRHWISSEGAGELGGLLVPVINYVQSSAVESFTHSDLASASFIVENYSRPDQEWRDFLVRGGSPLLRPSNPKVLFRLALEEGQEIRAVGEGNHSVKIVDDQHQELILPTSTALRVRHLPYRSRASLSSKRNLGRRRKAAGFDPTIGIQNQLLAARSDSALDALWEQVSYRGEGKMPRLALGRDSALIADPGLASVLQRVQSLEVDLEAWAKSKNRNAEFSPGPDRSSLQEQLFSLALDSPVGFP